MNYMGSKSRIAKYILPIMLQYRDNRTWVEPFVGGGNLIDKVSGDRIGSDINPHVIEALTIIRDKAHLLPKNNTEFTEADYKLLRNSDEYEFKSFAGFVYAYSGLWLHTWAKDNSNKRDFVKEAYNNAQKQSPILQNVKLIHCNYLDLEIPPNSLIYCYPPYQGKYSYKTEKFNHNEFWDWCRNKTIENHVVFISEYNAPDDFKCIWSKEICSSLTKDTGSKKAIEKLFVYNKI